MAETKRSYGYVQAVEIVNAGSISLTIGDIGIKGSSDGGTTFQFAHTDTSGDLQIDILSSALPTGAATSANQVLQIAASGTNTDAPVAYNGADEDGTARSHTSLLKRIANALKAACASLASIVTSVIDIPNIIGIPGATAPSKRMQVAGKASTSIPVAVTDGQTVGLYLDEYGRLVLKGYASGTDSNSVTETSPVDLQRGDLATYVNAVTTTTDGGWVNFTTKESIAFHLNCSAWSSGTSTVTIYGNNAASDTGAVLLDTKIFGATGVGLYQYSVMPYMKAVVTVSGGGSSTTTVGYTSKG
jgi:hypothetical protein